MFFRKLFLPWTVADAFGSPDQYRRRMVQCRSFYFVLRLVALVAAGIFLLLGYFAHSRPLTLLTIPPFGVMLFATLALGRIEPVLDGQTHNEP